MGRIAHLLLLAALVLTAAEVDLSGRWTGDVNTVSDGVRTQYPFVLNLKQDGAKFTGTMGPEGGNKLPILNGKLEANNFTLTWTETTIGKIRPQGGRRPS
jgi:hypothetical protein